MSKIQIVIPFFQKDILKAMLLFNFEYMIQRFMHTDHSSTTIIVRLMVGSVFLSEGIQKFLFADQLGIGRFTKIGLPNPEFLGPFVGAFEVVCGVLVLLGLFTRVAAIPLLVIILTAIAAIKMQILSDKGVWQMLHDSRTDWSMLLGSIFLIIKGGGNWSLDKKLWKR